MKKIITLVLSLTITTFAYNFVNPINYNDSPQAREYVVNYIKEHTQKQYAEIGMDDPLTLRMMESENLKAFKELIQVENKQLLERVIKDYCAIGMCDYNTLKMMYNEQLKASSKQLKW